MLPWNHPKSGVCIQNTHFQFRTMLALLCPISYYSDDFISSTRNSPVLDYSDIGGRSVTDSSSIGGLMRMILQSMHLQHSIETNKGSFDVALLLL